GCPTGSASRTTCTRRSAGACGSSTARSSAWTRARHGSTSARWPSTTDRRAWPMRKPSQEALMLRALKRDPVRVVAVTSGKGGVGKTNVAVNLAVSLGLDRRDVMLLDADLSLANVDVLLGLQPQYNLSHVLEGKVGLPDTVLSGPARIRIVPATSGNYAMTDLPVSSQAAIVHAFQGLERHPEWLIVDTASGISPSVARFVQAAQQAVVVICDEPASITDGYALIKVFSRHYGISHFQVVTNRTRDDADGHRLFT